MGSLHLTEAELFDAMQEAFTALRRFLEVFKGAIDEVLAEGSDFDKLMKKLNETNFVRDLEEEVVGGNLGEVVGGRDAPKS